MYEVYSVGSVGSKASCRTVNKTKRTSWIGFFVNEKHALDLVHRLLLHRHSATLCLFVLIKDTASLDLFRVSRLETQVKKCESSIEMFFSMFFKLNYIHDILVFYSPKFS